MEPAAEGYEPLSSRATWTQRALIAVVALNAVAWISTYFAYRLYQQDVVSQDDLDRTDIREGIVAAVWGVALVFAAVFFIRWFRRAYLNLPALGVTRLRFATWWSIGGWFIPIWSVFRPKQIANDLWRASDPDGPANRNLESVTGPVPSLFFWWWACYLVSSWLDGRSALADFNANGVDARSTAALLDMAADSFNIVAGIFAILVVRRTTMRLEVRASRLTAETGPETVAPGPSGG